jgi:hypothetical protein
MVMMTAAALTAGVTVNAFAFSDVVSHVVTRPVVITTRAVAAYTHSPRPMDESSREVSIRSTRSADAKGGVLNMARIFAVMLLTATACVVGSTPGFARGGVVHLFARGGVAHGLDDGFVRNPPTLSGASPPSSTFENHIRLPLAAPIPAPATNGPAVRSPYPGVM